MGFKFGNRITNNYGSIISKGSSVLGSTKGINPEKVEASMNRYLPNNEGLDSTSVLDELTPKSEDGLLRMFRSIAKTDSVGGPAIDMMSSFPWCDGNLSGIQDKDVASLYEEAFHMTDPQTYMPQQTASYLTDGKVVASLIYDSDRGTFTDIIPQDPMYLSFEPVPIKGLDPKVNYRSNPNFKKFFRSTDHRDSIARERIPSKLANLLATGGNVPLEPLNTVYIPRVTTPFDWLGTSMLWRILPFYALEKALWNASISTARRRARSVTHIKAGIQDIWEPTQSDLDNIVNLFMESEEDPVGAYVITRDGVETQDVRQANDFWKLSEEWDMLTTGKTRALGLSEALMSAETSLGTAEQGMILFIERIKVLRAELTNRFYYRKIFANIARAHGFVKKSRFESADTVVSRMDITYEKLTKKIIVEGSVNGRGEYVAKSGLTLQQAYDIAYSDLLIPEINWKKQLTPSKDSSYLDLLSTLEEKGVPINRKQWAAAGGLDINKQIEDIGEDLAIQSLIAEKIRGSKKDSKGKGKEDEEDEDDLGWAGSSTVPVTGVAEIFNTLVNSGNKVTFFGVGPKKLRKVLKNELFTKKVTILNDTKEVKKALSHYYEGNDTKIEAACYLLNRGLITDVNISKEFLDKVLARIEKRIKFFKGKDLRNLIKERNFVYSQYTKLLPKKKHKIEIPNWENSPDKLKGSRMYAGLKV